jgi:hypothetical protein
MIGQPLRNVFGLEDMHMQNPLGQFLGEEIMRKFLIATALIVAYATPALAEDFYVAVDLASGRCVMMSGKEPDAKHFKMMGKYASMDEAHKAMGTMRDCL